ncbi:hypothetical protein Q5P01_023346 [Channa striata]|uniref:Mucin-13 n=1 Tax=Channa striata TaxID=64152 RepID=A0AA88J207_CHASR|nr:hypothetical protein Q5P01_023346 [Channa striata]
MLTTTQPVLTSTSDQTTITGLPIKTTTVSTTTTTATTAKTEVPTTATIVSTSTSNHTTTTITSPEITSHETATTPIASTQTGVPTSTMSILTTATAIPTTTSPISTTPTSGPISTTEFSTHSTEGPTTSRVSATKPPGPCDINPCGRGSTCEVRGDQSFVCLCLAGEVYNDERNTCDNAKVFPGQLGLPKLRYNPKMSDKTSQEFNETSQNITDELSNIYSNSEGYIGSIVLELLPIPSRKDVSSFEGVSASVEITFNEMSDITTEEVVQTITTAQECRDCFLSGSSFNETDLCTKNPCDQETTDCLSMNGSFNCTCIESYIKTDFSGRMCIACPSGQQAQGSFKCVDCPFGYSGFNCNESWQLIVVIVVSVLSGLLLITLIYLPIVAMKSYKMSYEIDQNAEMGKPYTTNSPVKASWLSSNLAAIPRVFKIPRARTISTWNSTTNLDITPSNSQQTLISTNSNSQMSDGQSDLYPSLRSQPQTGGSAQAQPRNTPSARSQSQIDPYAQNQGQTNPHFTQHDGGHFI